MSTHEPLSIQKLYDVARRFRRSKVLLILLSSILVAPKALGEIVLRGQSAGMDFQVESVGQVSGVPWGMAFLNPSDVMFTIRSGGVGMLSVGNGVSMMLEGAPEAFAEGQGGMLDVAVPPGFVAGDWIYFTYSKKRNAQGATTLARARLRNRALVDWQELLVSESRSDTGRHFGSRIAFDDAEHVYFTIGDRGVRPNGQNLATHAGSVLRLNLDGTTPTDNPFFGSKGALPEIWSYGHRNPQGIVFDHGKGILWLIEHGPRGGDEINRILPGRNYGWPVVSHGKEYWGPLAVGEGTEKEGMEPPVKVYVPSIAPGSLLLYSGKTFPAWKGNLMAGALKLQHINRVTLDANGKAVGEERLLTELGERIRALAESPEGWIYLSTDSGKVLRIRPASGQ